MKGINSQLQTSNSQGNQSRPTLIALEVGSWELELT